ncbi:hypothetical protein ACQ4PT_035515 [Festuca glaucescens]
MEKMRWVTRVVGYLMHDMIFLALNRGLHWYVAVIIPEDRDIQILNSIPSMEPSDELQHTKKLKEVSKSHKWPDYDVHLWNRTTIKNMPKQKDQSSCGLFAFLFIEYWTGKKLSKKFTQKDVDIYRKQLPCDMLYTVKNKIDVRKMSKKPDADAVPARRSSRRKRKRTQHVSGTLSGED